MTTNAKMIPPTYDYVAHPLANMMPMIEGKEFDELKADIKDKGILQPIILWDDGTGLKIIDGRNRFRAGKEIGYAFGPKDFKVWEGTAEEAEAYVLSTNFHRRQLKDSEKQEIIRRQLEKNPTMSNRRIANKYGFSHVTVGKVRDRMQNPPEVAKFNRFREDFRKTFDALSDAHRVAFVKEWALDFRELLDA
jgi:ParB-like chromosome segregation protein Spo0J